MVERTNPNTCQHWLAVDVCWTDGAQSIFICASCESTLSPEYRDEFEWDYDIDHNLWRRYPKRKLKGDELPDYKKPWAKPAGDDIWCFLWEGSPGPIFVNRQVYEYFRDNNYIRPDEHGDVLNRGVERPQAPADSAD